MIGSRDWSTQERKGASAFKEQKEKRLGVQVTSMWKTSFQGSSLEFKPSYIKQEWPRIYSSSVLSKSGNCQPVGNTFYDILWWTWNIDIDIHTYIAEKKAYKTFFYSYYLQCMHFLFYSNSFSLSLSLSLSHFNIGQDSLNWFQDSLICCYSHSWKTLLRVAPQWIKGTKRQQLD